MRRRIVRRPQVERDLLDYFIYISRDSESAADLFLIEAEAAVARIAEMPGSGPVWESDDPRLQNIRHTSVSRRFRNYLIFYRVGRDAVDILTVIHGARDLPNLLRDLA